MTGRWTRLGAMLAVAAGLGLGLGLLTLASSKVALAGAIVLVAATTAIYVWLAGWRVGLVCLLIVTSFLDRFTFRLSSVDIRAEQLAAIIAVAALVYLLVSGRRGWSILRPNLAESLLAAWVAIALLSSLTSAPDVGRSVKGVALLAISALAVALPRRISAADRTEVDFVAEMLLLVFAAEAAYGTLAFLAHVFGSDVSLGANVASGHLNAYGTLWEPNVFGAFCASGALAWASLGRHRFPYAWLGIAVCLGGLIASFTRAGWVVGFVLLAITALTRQMRKRAAMQQLILGVAGAAVIGLAIIGAEQVGDYYVPVNNGTAIVQPSRHGLFGLLENPVDVIGRLDQINIAGPDIKSHLLIGNGVASFGERHPIAHQAEQHLANLELAVLNDTGLLGLLVFAAFGAAVTVAAWRRRRDPTVAGLGMATLVIALTNTATETTELMVTWLMVGLLLLAVEASMGTGSATAQQGQ